MHLSDINNERVETLKRLASEPELRCDMRVYVENMPYNDTGLICAHLRATGFTRLAEYVEKTRLR